jgi:cytohesin
MAAAGGGHTDVIGTLLKSGAKVNEEDNDGETALHYAAAQSRGQTIRALVEAHAEVDHESRSGKTPLMVAAAGAHSDAVDALLEAGARPNRRNHGDKDWTALMYAAKGGTTTVIDSLASHEAQVNVEDATGDQAIHIAARAGNFAIVGELIDKGSNVNERGGTDHRSPLEIAVDRDDLSTAEMLVSHHACVTRNAVDCAAKKKSEKMIKLLADNSGNDCRNP